MRIITRAEWGARSPKTTPAVITTPTPELWLHHAAGAVLPGDDTVSPADLSRITGIQNFHMDVRGWNDIAYSFLMDPDGNVFEGRGFGIRGAHTAGHNTVSHAICVMGNYDSQEIDSDLLPRLAELVSFGHSQGYWPEVFTGGHKDASGASTSCPGLNLYTKLPEINKLATTGGEIVSLYPFWLYDGFDEEDIPAGSKARRHKREDVYYLQSKLNDLLSEEIKVDGRLGTTTMEAFHGLVDHTNNEYISGKEGALFDRLWSGARYVPKGENVKIL